ncbi:MAG TPA: YciI family protein [Ktedonobacterales bacterium]|jgi:uncharacterized protein YciI
MSQRYATYFAMVGARGERWDASRTMSQQGQYKEHMAFLDALTDDGLVILGGPLGEREERFLFIFAAENADEVEARLADDPWMRLGIVLIASVERWDILVQSA